PGGASAAIYAARKGIRTGVVSERVGGQVLDTAAIENFVSIKSTKGPQLGKNLEDHVKDYNEDVMNLQRATRLEKNDLIELELDNGADLKNNTFIFLTGACWQRFVFLGNSDFSNYELRY